LSRSIRSQQCRWHRHLQAVRAYPRKRPKL